MGKHTCSIQMSRRKKSIMRSCCYSTGVISWTKKGQADAVSDAIRPILRRAIELNQRRVPWHHHILFPGCMYSQDKAKWAIAFEDPETGEATEIVYEEEPVGDFRQIELLFFGQDMFQD